MKPTGWQFWIDRGGTFTDIVARAPDGRLIQSKLLSEHPGRHRDAAIAGIRALLGLGHDDPIPAGAVVNARLATHAAAQQVAEQQLFRQVH